MRRAARIEHAMAAARRDGAGGAFGLALFRIVPTAEPNARAQIARRG
jgi:hypothetical protein